MRGAAAGMLAVGEQVYHAGEVRGEEVSRVPYDRGRAKAVHAPKVQGRFTKEEDQKLLKVLHG